MPEYNCDINLFLRSKINQLHPDRSIRKQILRVINTQRNESLTVDRNEAASDAGILESIMHGKSSSFLAKSIFYEKSFNHIAAVTDAYQIQTGQRIDAFILNNFKRNNFTITNIVIYSKFTSYYFSSLLERSMKRFGLDSTLLSSIILMRCEQDMVDIKREFVRKNGKSLKDCISGVTSGDYKNALYALIGEQTTESN